MTQKDQYLGMLLDQGQKIWARADPEPVPNNS